MHKNPHTRCDYCDYRQIENVYIMALFWASFFLFAVLLFADLGNEKDIGGSTMYPSLSMRMD